MSTQDVLDAVSRVHTPGDRASTEGLTLYAIKPAIFRSTRNTHCKGCSQVWPCATIREIRDVGYDLTGGFDGTEVTFDNTHLLKEA